MKKLRLLIVEDQRAVRQIWDRALSDTVFEKLFANDGEEGIKLFKSWKPDAVLLDVMLPIVNGRAVLEEIRENMGDKSTPVIMQTSLSDKSDILECLHLGIQGYIIKPFDGREIWKKIINYVKHIYPAWAEEAEAILASGKDQTSRTLSDLG